MRVVITGADGFIGQNLRLRLDELRQGEVVSITRGSTSDEWRDALDGADVVVHLAGVNRPEDPGEFVVGNTNLTVALCDALRTSARAVPVIYTSSSQAALDNPYGRSKRDAEAALLAYGADSGAGVAILRLVNVFGKWARPNYNSAVATFCHNVARGLPIAVADPAAVVRLLHIDDVMEAILALIRDGVAGCGEVAVGPVHNVTVGELASTIEGFRASRQTLDMARVGTGFLRALYSTYVSYLPAEEFSYALTRHEDPRGVFAEMLRTTDSGQFSFFTAHPGVTRGGHYHHTKTEKFLVVKGTARFGFRHVLTGQMREVTVVGSEARVVETVPGWVHDITNIGDDEMFVLLWANEAFDPQQPDTVAARVTP